MSQKRFIVIVLDGFGIGAMDDAAEVRPQDINANTAKHIIEANKNIKFDILFKLGLMNALGGEILDYKINPRAVFGASKLAHFGCDTFFGHQEIMGTKPIKPVLNKFSDFIDVIESDLKSAGYETKRFTQNGLQLLCVNSAIFVGDNLETDPGQAINVTGSFDLTDFDEIKKVGQIVRERVKVSRVIAFGGKNVTFKDLTGAIREKNGYIGVDAPKSKVYLKDYQVVHIGYGVNADSQLPQILFRQNIKSFLYGKVADIVKNPHGKLFTGVDTDMIFDELEKDLKSETEGFFCLNVQQTDLAGHAQDTALYTERLNIASVRINKIIQSAAKDDIILITADHGNDPTTSKNHTREKVPILIYKEGLENINIGIRETLADIGATAAAYLAPKQKLSFGKSFLDKLN
jgi:phosphopentomutase